MKSLHTFGRRALLTGTACLLLFTSAAQQADSLKKEKVITGWIPGPLPAVSYDKDLGFQYGVLLDLHNYADGTRYPGYDHWLYFEVSAYTRGSGVFRMMYDTDRLLRNWRLTADFSYIPNQAYNFFGWNGYEAVYNKAWQDDTQPDSIYKSRVFYRMLNKMFRFKVDLQIPWRGNWKWLAGYQWYYFRIGPVNIDRLNRGKDGDDKLPSLSEQPILFTLYKAWGLLPEDEANGGWLSMLKAGLIYDSRDIEANPMHGIWAEAALEGAPDFLGSIRHSYLKVSAVWRQYFTLIPRDLSLAVRLALQTTVAGHAPFYVQPLMITTVLRSSNEEGLGGIRNLRGIPRNRVVGDGVAYGNLELRWKFWRTHIFGQNFYFGINAFADAGQVIDKIDIRRKVEALHLPDQDKYFDFGSESMHASYGFGLRIAMNQNFVIAVDYGIAVDNRDGDDGLYVGLNYLF